MDIADYKSLYIGVHSGTRFYPFDPKAKDIYFEDIAHALSRIPRFGGHCERFWSVGAHSLMVCDIAQSFFTEIEQKRVAGLCGLFHDGSEAYIGDMVRPLKKAMLDYQLVESLIMNEIAWKFCRCKLTDFPKEVWLADDIALATECEVGIFGTKIEGLPPPRITAHMPYVNLSMDDIKRIFTQRYHELRA